MTWTKLSDDFGDQCAKAGLSDAAFRTHVEGLLWSMRRETGGRLSHRDLRRFGESEDVDQAVKELTAAGFWLSDGDGYVVVHHMEHQPEPDVIDARRKNDAERQRRSRRKKAGVSRRDETRDETRDVHRDNPRDPGRDGSGRAGVANPSYRQGEVAQDDEWPPVPSVDDGWDDE